MVSIQLPQLAVCMMSLPKNKRNADSLSGMLLADDTITVVGVRSQPHIGGD
jgi:hypothetical protein